VRVGPATGYVSHVIVQICRCRLLAVCVLGERNGNDGQSMRRLTTWRLKSALPGRARRGGHGAWPSSATVTDRDSGQRKPVLPTGVCGALPAEMVPPNLGLRARARRMVRPVLGSADHPTSARAPRSPRPKPRKRSIPSLADPPSPDQRHGRRHKQSAPIYIDYRCINAVQ
jgi:hypothetical protein